MSILSIVCHLFALCFFNSYHALEQLPKDTAPTEEIRGVVNQIFSGLKLKRKQDSKLGEYSTIHKHFVGLTQLENDSWKRMTKLTTIDSKIDNGTTDLTTIINEILNEENNTVETNGTPYDDDVNEYIDSFLSTLARLKELYLVNDTYSSINTGVLEHFYRNSVSGVDEINSTESHNSTDELEFWTPTETRRIYRGKKTKIKYFPFLASVHIFDQFTCAGSLIQSSLVVTAASCLQLAYNNRFFRENPAFLAVRIGSPFFNAGGERISVLEVYFYPTYTPRTLKDNIAVMRLEKIIKFRRGKRNVKKIQIDRSDWNLPVNSRGVIIAGWGARTTNNKIKDPWSNKVSMAHLPIYPLEDCQDIYSKEYVTRKNFCAGFFSKGGGACNRDVGAPGVANGLLMGIASFGAPSCGTVDAPTVFTKVGYYYDWIETIMEQDIPHLKIRTTTRSYLIEQNVIPFVVNEPKQFKIVPIVPEDMKKIVDSRNINRLRMDEGNRGDQNSKFENFLGTMFNAKDQKDHKDETPSVKRQKPTADEYKNENANKIYKELLTTPSRADEGNFDPVKYVTNIDAFDPEAITSQETDLDVGMNLTELEKIAQVDEVDDDKLEASEKRGKTTPILEEYGLSIELSDKSKEEKQHYSSNYDSECKHQIEKSDEAEKYTSDSTKFNRNPNFQIQEQNESKKDTNYDTLKHDFHPEFNTKSKNQAAEPDRSFEDIHQLNKKRQDQLKELEKLINDENENNKEIAQQMRVPDEPLKDNLDIHTNRVQKLQRPVGASVADLAASDNFVKKLPYQVMKLKESKDINDNTQFNKQPKLQVEFPDESVKYKDVIDQLNKEHQQYQAEETQLNNDQEDDIDAIARDIIQDYTQLNDKLLKESNHQVEAPYVREIHYDAKTQTEPKQQAGELDTREINRKHTRWQHHAKKPGKIMKEFKNQGMEPDLSEGYANANNKTKKMHDNQVTKRDDTSPNIDVSPLINRGLQVNEQYVFERNSRPQFDTKLVHGIKAPEKKMQHSDIKDSKQQVRHDVVHNQFKNKSENLNQKLNESKNENIDKKLDEQIDQLLKNLDVENNIGSGLIENSHDKKVIEDDTLLTFLLMTDNDRYRNETIEEIGDSDEESEYYGREGMIIDGEHYEELTHRTNATDESYKIMSKSDMYDILVDAVQADDAAV